jgi:hypothetical protein
MLRGSFIVLAAALAAWSGLAGAQVSEGAPPLAAVQTLDSDQVSVSGISSGGFFAHQFHVAYSELVNGAGVLAGGPYACAEQIPAILSFNPMASVVTALGVCSHISRTAFDPFDIWLPDGPSAEAAVEMITTEHDNGHIDDPANLADDRVWLFLGDADDVVPLATMQALEGVYARLGLAAPALQFERNELANHGVPVEAFTGTSEHPERACGDYGLPFIIDCDFDAAERLLRHLYPADFANVPGEPEPESLLAFDQTAFFDATDASVSLAETGFVYVPAVCRGDAPATAACRLHVAFHGCQQYTALIDDDFYWGAAYNRWAEANRIVVLYPQTTAWNRTLDPTGLTANPRGCWDSWGYSSADYFRQNGKQMQAVRQMIDRLLL